MMGIVYERGKSNNGGNYIYILGVDLRLYYFAHLESISDSLSLRVEKGQILGYVGDSGNAMFTPCHLHFSIFSLIPIISNYNSRLPDGWKRMFYLDPSKLWI